MPFMECKRFKSYLRLRFSFLDQIFSSLLQLSCAIFKFGEWRVPIMNILVLIACANYGIYFLRNIKTTLKVDMDKHEYLGGKYLQ